MVHDAFAEAAKKAPEIGEPIIDKAVEDNKITAAQADQIREMLKRGPGGRGPGFDKRRPGPAGRPRFADADVRAVLEDVHDAVAKEVPAIAGPVIDKAEEDDKITRRGPTNCARRPEGLGGGKPRGLPPRGLNRATPMCAR